MAKLIVLVGPPGSGKSTFCEKFPGYTRISQDDLGAKYGALYEQALAEGKDIIVDRMNFSQGQRSIFLHNARKKGYFTQIVVAMEPPETCFDRIKARIGHPTLKPDNDKKILQALWFFKSRYERPLAEEADEIIYLNDKDDWYIRTVAYPALVVGDIHGCFDEFQKLPQTNIPIISCGDVIDRGPKIWELLHWISQNRRRFYMVLGNHEDKFIRWLIGNKVEAGYLEQTIKQAGTWWDESKISTALFLMEFPWLIRIDGSSQFLVTHAGVNYYSEPERQDSFYLRYIRDDWWSEDPECFRRYRNIFFGHCPKLETNDHRAICLDGGCAYGGTLKYAMIDEEGDWNMGQIESSFNCKADGDPCSILEPYEAAVLAGRVEKKEKGSLILYTYSRSCQYDRDWTPITRQCRGIIFNKHTGAVVARPFEKFFNLGEMPETQLENLPLNEQMTVTKKEDGSLIIMFWNPDSAAWDVCTKGSFISEQALFVKEHILANLKIPEEFMKYTLLWEYVSPKNRIVMKYGYPQLKLLTAIETETGKELSDREVTKLIYETLLEENKNQRHYLGRTEVLPFKSPKEVVEALPAYQGSNLIEGFVIHFESGLRVKLKTEEYCRLHKIVTNLTPKRILEMLRDYSFEKEMVNLPEEFREESAQIATEFRRAYKGLFKEVQDELIAVLAQMPPNPTRKDLGLFIQTTKTPLKHAKALFPLFLDQIDRLRTYIFNYIEDHLCLPTII